MFQSMNQPISLHMLLAGLCVALLLPSPICSDEKGDFLEITVPWNSHHHGTKSNIDLNLKVYKASAGYLFAENTDNRLNLSDPIDEKLSTILERDGPDLRSSRDSKDFKDVSLDVSKRAWQLLHEHASRAIIDRIEVTRPVIEQLLVEAKVSFKCLNSTRLLFDNAMNMESWAIKLLNSWGNFPPTGIFEGTFGEMGSYHTCVHIPKNDQIDHAHYCSLAFRPIMPSRSDYELVVRKEPDELLNMFEKLNNKDQTTSVLGTLNFKPNNRNAFTDILQQAQYHHYIYYKLGTCWPIQCTPFDVKRVVKLVARRNMLMAGPVKCFSLNRDDYEYEDTNQTISIGMNTTTQSVVTKKLVISHWDLNNGIFIWKPNFHTTQWVSLAIVLVLTGAILLMTAIDIVANRVPQMLKLFKFAFLSVTMENGLDTKVATTTQLELQEAQVCMTSPSDGAKLPSQDFGETTASIEANRSTLTPSVVHREIAYSPKKIEITGFMGYVEDCSLLNSYKQFLRITEGQMKNDILCLNGIRCLTMVWIIMTHTMMYNDWAGFARTRDIEKSITSLIVQPFFNGSYLVDTFFLMSGLLSAFQAFRQCKGQATRFNSLSYIVGRWLRLTPQIFFVDLLFILLPALSDGPQWFPLVGEYSENCTNNWWINLFHIQAFFRTEKMCNFVTWWVSIDFFLHYMGLLVIWVMLWANHRFGFLTVTGLVSSQVAYQMYRHYQKSLPPNILSTIPQTGDMWSEMTLGFFWKPYAHAVPFFFGFYVGYLMAMKQKLIYRFLNLRRAIIGWTVTGVALLGQSFSTHWWVIGSIGYSRWVATICYTIYPIIWAGSFCWIIIACQHGYGGFLNRFLSMKMWVVLGKASYLVYLSHFQVIFAFFGSSNLLLEPTEFVMFYIILGNIVLSTIYGVILCIVYEHPWLKFHKRIMKKLF